MRVVKSNPIQTKLNNHKFGGHPPSHVINHNQISIDTISTKNLLSAQISGFYSSFSGFELQHTQEILQKKRKKEKCINCGTQTPSLTFGMWELKLNSQAVQNLKLLFSSCSYFRSVRLFKTRISFSDWGLGKSNHVTGSLRTLSK